jgi:hypothetical protein
VLRRRQPLTAPWLLSGRAFDGDTKTQWQSKAILPHWIMYDRGQVGAAVFY